jgi:hypothetical protein
MKSKLTILFIPCCMFFIALGATQAAHHESEESGIKDEELETIYVEYRENLVEIRAPRYNGLFNELDRYHYFKRNFEKAFENEEWPVRFEYGRFPIKVPDGATVLEVTFLSLKSHNRIELELRIWSKLNDGSDKNDFGIQLARHVPSPIYSSSSIDRDLDTIYSKAADRVVQKMNGSLFKKE